MLEEYKQVFQGEWKKEFVFRPESFVENPREFTEELLRYAKECNSDITILKESMYPEFIWNGIEYSAYRVHTRYGATVHCEMKHPELVEPENVTGAKKKIMQFIARSLPGLCIVFFCSIMIGVTELTPVSIGILITIVIIYIIGAWYPNRKKK